MEGSAHVDLEKGHPPRIPPKKSPMKATLKHNALETVAIRGQVLPAMTAVSPARSSQADLSTSTGIMNPAVDRAPQSPLT